MMQASHIYHPRRVSRFGWLGLMLVGVVLVVVLFIIKAHALEARSKLRELEHTLAQEKAEIRMINAEIAHLESPERLRKLSKEHLGLEPVKVEQTLTLAEAVALMPRKPVLENPVSEPQPQVSQGQNGEEAP